MSQPPQSPPPKVRNLRTQALNRRESFWQIALPLAVAVLAAVALMVLVVIGTAVPARTSAFADVSLMFLILIASAGGLLVFALVAGLCVGLWFALRELPYLFKRVQDYARLVAHHTGRVAAPLNESVLSVGSFVAAARQAAVSVRSILASGR